MLLAGDIGGTNVRLDFYQDDGRTPIGHPRRGAGDGTKLPMTYRGCDIRTALTRFADDFPEQVKAIDRACFGIAGAIATDEDGTQHVAMTNRPDEDITNADIGQILGANVVLVNDMAAHIASVGVAPRQTLQEGKPEPGGTRAILMPGTGCGVGFAVKCGEHHQPAPSEGGHMELPPRTVEQERLLRSLRTLLPAERHHYRVTYESVLSGPGLENVYACLVDRRSPRLRPEATAQAITEAAAGRASTADARLAADTVRLFTEFLGQYAGNLGVLLMPTGGMFLGGNIAHVVREPAPDLFDQRVTRAFLGAGSPVHREVLANMAVYLLDPTDTGLLGAAQIASRL